MPPPTPIHLPQCRPASAGAGASAGLNPDAHADADSEEEAVADGAPLVTTHLTTLLQGLVRPADQVQMSHLEALGVCVIPDASLADLIPGASPSDPDWSLPPFDQWDTLSREETIDGLREDAQSRPKLCNGKVAPGPTKYVDLRSGLLTENQRAFRSVRRVTPRPGEQYVRLGYSHEFFRNLEALTTFWDDTSVEASPPANKTTAVEGEETVEKPPSPDDNFASYRTSAGSAMPPSFRTQVLNSFLKLVTYDFNCNIMSRVEPRLYLQSPLYSSSPSPTTTTRRSQFSSGCSFIYRMPLDRESAKRGIVEGPIAAVSPRHTTSFPPLARDREAIIDLSREIIAALITAQHRAREGRVETRFGKDTWWTTRRRWGGGSGGPIGKEAELLEAKEVGAVVVGDKDERPLKDGAVVEGDGAPPSSSSPSTSLSSLSSSSRPSRPLSLGGPRSHRFNRPIPPSFASSRNDDQSTCQPPNPAAGKGGDGRGSSAPPPKRPRTSLAIYDAYRMVRPPARHWDSKTRHEAIGRQRGVDYDDVFVISSLFHHISILRVRVPDRLLAVLDGGPEEDEEDENVDGTGKGRGGKGGKKARKLDVYRTKWYDFFIPEDRVEAMKAIWAVMAYAMRENPKPDGQEGTTTTTTTTTSSSAPAATTSTTTTTPAEAQKKGGANSGGVVDQKMDIDT